MRTIVGATVVMVVVYLVVSHATEGGKLLTSAGTAYGGVVKVFQGR